MENMSYEEKKQMVEDTIEKYSRYINPALARYYKFAQLDTVEWSSSGTLVYDIFGEPYLDCLGGFGVFTVGRNHPRVVKAVREQLERLPLSTRALFNKQQADLAERIALVTPGNLQYSFFCNSGTEAVEGAIKLARMYTGRKKLVSAFDGYHGKTMGSLSVSGKDAYKKPFEPCVPETFQVPFNDEKAMEKAVDENTAAVILEPVQGEGGINLAREGYLARVKKLCERSGALLILDEVQTGLGRTGKMFACEHSGVVPDIMTLAKGLGGGVLPLGAFVSTAQIWEVFDENPYIHSSTLGGNPLACVAGLATLSIIEEEGLCEHSAEKGRYLLEKLEKIQNAFPQLITAVRGLGLMIGTEFPDSDVASLLGMEMAQRKVLVAYTMDNRKVIRFEPPLTVSYQELDTILERFTDALGSVQSIVEEIGGEEIG